MENNEAFQLPAFDEFLLLMKKSVEEAIGTGYKVEINHVIKNNSIELDGLIILKENERITPNIYMSTYYERYLAGVSAGELVEEIIRVYRNNREEGEKEDLHIRYELDEMKTRIIYRLVNYDRNSKLLSEVPHVHFMDLAVTFHCLIKNNEKGIATIRITNEHIRNWKINPEDLKKIARANTPLLFPPVIKKMDEIILDIFKKEQDEFSADCGDSSFLNPHGTAGEDLSRSYVDDEFYQSMTDNLTRQKTDSMYVITNIKGINGASCLLYPDVIKNLAQMLDADLYLLPSSIHEIIAIKAKGSVNKNVLREMVFDVNRTQVPDEDILSDNVYFYSRERNAITM